MSSEDSAPSKMKTPREIERAKRIGVEASFSIYRETPLVRPGRIENSTLTAETRKTPVPTGSLKISEMLFVIFSLKSFFNSGRSCIGFGNFLRDTQGIHLTDGRVYITKFVVPSIRISYFYKNIYAVL